MSSPSRPQTSFTKVHFHFLMVPQKSGLKSTSDLLAILLCRSSRPPVSLQYADGRDLDLEVNLADKKLRELYPIFTYRYFLCNWPNLCVMAFDSTPPPGGALPASWRWTCTESAPCAAKSTEALL